MNYIVWLVISSICYAIGGYFSKKYALSQDTFLLICLLIAYNIGSITWIPAICQKSDLALVGTLWAVLSSLITIIVGIVIFQESITLLNGIGIFFAIISIIFLSL